MQPATIQQIAGNTDIYLLDQIIKGRYNKNERVLDAGCGTGRNLHWYLLNQIDCYGIDKDFLNIEHLKLQYPFLPADRLQTSEVEDLPFTDGFFDHVISSAVLHFAKSYQQFSAMFIEMERVLKPCGTLFIRMTSNIGIENLAELIADGVYSIPDGSTRFLLTKPLLQNLLKDHPFILIEPLKTVNVEDARCMSTLVLQKAANNQAHIK